MWIPASLPITQFSASYGTEDRRPKPDVAAFLPLFMDVPNKKASKSLMLLEALIQIRISLLFEDFDMFDFLSPSEFDYENTLWNVSDHLRNSLIHFIFRGHGNSLGN